jgi:hypothetical protein
METQLVARQSATLKLEPKIAELGPRLAAISNDDAKHKLKAETYWARCEAFRK